MIAWDKSRIIPLLQHLSIKLVELLPLELSRDHPVQIDRSRGRRSSLTLWKLFLFIFPLLDAVGDVDSNALGAKVSAADVTRHGHGHSGGWCHLSRTGNHWQMSAAVWQHLGSPGHQWPMPTHHPNTDCEPALPHYNQMKRGTWQYWWVSHFPRFMQDFTWHSTVVLSQNHGQVEGHLDLG